MCIPRAGGERIVTRIPEELIFRQPQNPVLTEPAQTVTGQTPERVTTDGHTSYPRAIRETLGEQVEHRCNRYLNNHLEQDHRGIKQRYYPMRGFGSFEATSLFCSAFDEQRDYFRA